MKKSIIEKLKTENDNNDVFEENEDGDLDEEGTTSVNKGMINLVFPPGTAGNEYPIFVLQFNSNSMSCPKDYCKLYIYVWL